VQLAYPGSAKLFVMQQLAIPLVEFVLGLKPFQRRKMGRVRASRVSSQHGDHNLDDVVASRRQVGKLEKAASSRVLPTEAQIAQPVLGSKPILATDVGYAAGRGQALYGNQTRCLRFINVPFVDIKPPRLHVTSIRSTCHVARSATDPYGCGNGVYAMGTFGVGLNVVDELVKVRANDGLFRKARLDGQNVVLGVRGGGNGGIVTASRLSCVHIPSHRSTAKSYHETILDQRANSNLRWPC
jgi:hypothetical protein